MSDLSWRRLPFSDAPMGRQLALSEALLAECATSGTPALRWYLPAEPALVLGNGQKPRIADLAACRTVGVRVYRRTSGGAAVLVNAELLSLDIILPAGHALWTSDIVHAYRWVGAWWEDALHTLGAEKARAIPTEEVRAIPPLTPDDPLRLACYGTLSPWEVVVGRRKLVGLCQVRRRPGALYQIGVYRRFDPKALGQVLDLNNTTRKTLATRLHNATVGLDQSLGREVPHDEVMRAVEKALVRRDDAQLEDSDYTERELASADRLQRERFEPFE
jgi:lipoate-protein ligase A